MKQFAAVALVWCGLPAAAQMSFEAASIKPGNPDGPSRFGRIQVRGDRFSATSVTLRELIVSAFEVEPYQIVEGPKWLDTEKYDIDARAGTVPTREQRRTMEQAMVKERFQLKYHRESREIAVYGLVVAKGGPKFKEGSYLEPPWGPHRINFRDLNSVAAGISRFTPLDRPVINQTGLTGQYRLTVDTSETMNPETREGRTVEQVIQQTILEQLGLKLVTAKAAIEMFVIEGVERASAN